MTTRKQTRIPRKPTDKSKLTKAIELLHDRKYFCAACTHGGIHAPFCKIDQAIAILKELAKEGKEV